MLFDFPEFGKPKNMKIIRLKRLIIGCFVLFCTLPAARSQAMWELGVKGGTDFYLGDVNSTLFNALQPAFGAYTRYNINYRWVLKMQGMAGYVNQPFKQDYVDASVQAEFNFFDYGMMSSSSWTRWFSPYICAGLGLSIFENINEKRVFSASVPFGVGVKLKLFKKMNISLEWTMHKLFSDEFDYVNNPLKQEMAWLANRDWYSMATIMIGIDLGDKSRFCRNGRP